MDSTSGVGRRIRPKARSQRDVPRAVGVSWYANELDGVVPLSEAVAHHAPVIRRLIERVSVVRALALFGFAVRGSTLVMTNPGLVSKVCSVLCSLIGRRRIVMLELIQHQRTGERGLRRWLDAVELAIQRVIFQRSVAVAQVLSDSDVENYASLYRVPQDRMALVRWPSHTATEEFGVLAPAGRRVMASGKRVDWPTFFAAARGTDWLVTAVCTSADEAAVRDQIATARIDADLYVEIPPEQHHALMLAADVYVLAVAETGTSIGHIRVMNAIDAGVPLVASDVAALRGYVTTETARLVPPSDPAVMRREIDALLRDPDARDALRRAAREASSISMDQYLRELSQLVASVS